jgi:hypothetical protein
MSDTVPSHARRPLSVEGLPATEVRLSPAPTRLVVFVHGWNGNPLTTWRNFDESGQIGEWWRASDLLFIGYASRKRDPAGIADQLRDVLLAAYPRRPSSWMHCNGTAPAAPAPVEYGELYLVAHSLGGPVIRQMLADLGRDAPGNADPHRQRILRDARVRLFSPAIGGFFPSGALGTARAFARGRAEEILMAHDPAFQALRIDSEFLTALRTETERLAKEHPMIAAFKAQTLWANPDRVVKHQNYQHDDSYTKDGVKHGSVCKPREDYPLPWHFVETGATPPIAL